MALNLDVNRNVNVGEKNSESEQFPQVDTKSEQFPHVDTESEPFLQVVTKPEQFPQVDTESEQFPQVASTSDVNRNVSEKYTGYACQVMSLDVTKNDTKLEIDDLSQATSKRTRPAKNDLNYLESAENETPRDLDSTLDSLMDPEYIPSPPKKKHKFKFKSTKKLNPFFEDRLDLPLDDLERRINLHLSNSKPSDDQLSLPNTSQATSNAFPAGIPRILNKPLPGPDGSTIEVDDPRYMVEFTRQNKRVPGTTRAYKAELARLCKWADTTIEYCDVFTNLNNNVAVEPNLISCMVANYFQGRANITAYNKTGELTRLEPTTTNRAWSSLVAEFSDQFDIDLNSKEYELGKKTKTATKREARRVFKKGNLPNQSTPWRKPQVVYLLQSDMVDIWYGEGLTWLTFLLTNILFFPREEAEMRNITRADFIRLIDGKGGVDAVAYKPRGCTKRDQGDTIPHHNAGHFKCPVAPRCHVIDKLDFHTVLSEMEYHLDKVPLLDSEKNAQGTRDDQHIFKQFKRCRPSPEEGFYTNVNLGLDYWRTMVRAMASHTGLKLFDKQHHNQSMRTTLFSLHEQLNIAPDVTAAMAGHSSNSTQTIYKRARSTTTAQANATLLTSLTGVKHVVPSDDYVMLRNGKSVKVDVDNFLKNITISTQEMP